MLELMVLILSCGASQTKARREAVRETWLAHGLPDGMKHLFVIGRPGQQPAVCGDILYVDAPDSYMELPVKVWTSIREMLARFQFNWLFKCDDDTFVIPQRLFHYPRLRDYIGRKIVPGEGNANWYRLVPEKELIGPTLNVHQWHATAWNKQSYNSKDMQWASGGCYFLSRKACALVAAEPLEHVRRDAYEDKMIGNIMASHGIYLHGDTNKQFRMLDWNESPEGGICMHPCDPKLMRELYYRLYRAGEMVP